MATTVQDIIAQLRQPIPSLEVLEDLLSAPLLSCNINAGSSGIKLAAPPTVRQLATLQATILACVYPTWESRTSLLDTYFCPPRLGKSEPASNALVLGALPLLTTPPLSTYVVQLLEKFVKAYSLEDIWKILDSNSEAKWDESLRSWIGIPGKVANAVLGSGSHRGVDDIPSVLRSEEFLAQTCRAAEGIIWSTAIGSRGDQISEDIVNKLVQMITKLVQTGHFSPSSSSFFPLVLPRIISRLHSADTEKRHSKSYKRIWCRVVESLPGPLLQTFASSLISYLGTASSQTHRSVSHIQTNAPASTSIRFTSYRIAVAFQLFLGSAVEATPEVWTIILGNGKAWNQDIARAVVGWAAGIGLGEFGEDLPAFDDLSKEIFGERFEEPIAIPNEERERGLEVLLQRVLDKWTDSQFVSRALLNEHQYLTYILVLTLGALSSLPVAWSNPLLTEPDLPLPAQDASQPKTHPLIESTSTSPTFLRSVGSYLSHRDEAIRRCGMLVAEQVSGGKLDFGDWGPNDNGDPKSIKEWQVWAANLRAQARDPLLAIQKQVEETKGEDIPVILDGSSRDAPQHEPHPNLAPEVAEVDSDDESLVGYAPPSDSSSRAPSPTPSELEDPTLRRRPITKPVYLTELGAFLVEAPKNVVEVQPGEGMIGFGTTTSRRGMGITGGRGGGDAEDEKSRVEMALESGAELIRRKRGYGSELEENAVNLAYLFMGLQDNFDLDRFEEKRQDILVALVACCPTKAAPTIIEQFFHHQYSTAQRFTMLNALAIGARELAGLPIPPPPHASDKRPRIDFPSKALPAGAHTEYIAEDDLPRPVVDYARIQGSARPQIESMRSQVSSLVEDLSGMAIARSKQETEQQIPQVVRERSLKVGPKPGKGISQLDSNQNLGITLGYLSPQTPVVPFAQVAAEFFVAPLINRFWNHLQSSLALEAYSRDTSGVRIGTGTGLILSPLVLTQLLGTLSVLLHAARHAPAFLHVLAPESAELALAIGTQPLTRSERRNSDEGVSLEGAGTEAGVLAAALELALTVLDSALELDGGQVFALERSDLLLGIGQWASTVFESLDRGERVSGAGGKDEDKAARIAAGLVLTSERILSRWRRSINTF